MRMFNSTQRSFRLICKIIYAPLLGIERFNVYSPQGDFSLTNQITEFLFSLLFARTNSPSRKPAYVFQ